MKTRDKYLTKLIQYKDNEFVKVITGVRRSGKSSILQLFKEYLLEQNTSEENIIEINYEKFIFEELKDGKNLHKYKWIKLKMILKYIY
ncbi:AAA family ATPase [Helicovermis profundi]|uniref:AAA domain-containing protein n=1 Tax=Helicovermis profundi TaxID=3065157 RepID=A0AAU9EI70_9FIRM|nr:hypothetical protein HLPR_15690 [Clostridia bacterium S502]